MKIKNIRWIMFTKKRKPIKILIFCTKISIIFLTMLLTGCATYFMTPESLQCLLKKGKPMDGNTQINCTDKDGKDVVLVSTIHTSIRITKKDDSRQQFYFITSFLKDSLIMGSKSAIFNLPIKPIKISEIKKVEFDGR